MNSITTTQVFEYTTQDAEKDGTLINIYRFNSLWTYGAFSHVSDELLQKGYYTVNKYVHRHYLTDLLLQCYVLLHKHTVITDLFDIEEVDDVRFGEIRLPNGNFQEIYLVLVKYGKYKIILPEEY